MPCDLPGRRTVGGEGRPKVATRFLQSQAEWGQKARGKGNVEGSITGGAVSAFLVRCQVLLKRRAVSEAEPAWRGEPSPADSGHAAPGLLWEVSPAAL